MNILYLDLETFSGVDLIKQGSYKYAQNCEILLFAYAVNNESVKIIDIKKEGLSQLNQFKPDLNLFDRVIAHNCTFDRLVLESKGFYFKNWYDTAVLAKIHNLPPSLDGLCEYFNISQDKAKLKDGKKLIRLFSKPRPSNCLKSRADKTTHPEEWEHFKQYAANDIEAMRELYLNHLPKINDTENIWQEWKLDQEINDRGFFIDVDLIEGAVKVDAAYKENLNKEMHKLTDGEINTTGQVAKIKEALTYEGLHLQSLSVEDVKKGLKLAKTDKAKKLLHLRQEGSKSSTSKYLAFSNLAGTDYRVRGCLRFAWAHTARWGGAIVQPQNFPRDSFKDPEPYITAVKNGYIQDLISPSIALKKLIRSVICAPEGYKLICCDLSNIEGRVLAWLAGEIWKLKAFKAFDMSRGEDLYKLTYSKTFGIPVENVNSDLRRVGKVLELAMGYGGGVSSFLASAESYGFDINTLHGKNLNSELKSKSEWYYDNYVTALLGLSRELYITCDTIKRMWRKENSKIEEFWYTVENAFKMAISGLETTMGKLTFKKFKDIVGIQLPSGRWLCYNKAFCLDKTIYYSHYDSQKRKMEVVKTWGGSLVADITQSTARDIIMYHMFLLKGKGYNIVLHVHDEIVMEMPKDEGWIIDVAGIMSQQPPWAKGLPLNAAGYEGPRFKKD